MARSLKSSLRWLFADRFLRLFATVPVTVWVARSLAPEDFGRLGFALGLATVALWMAQAGLERMLRRDLAERPHDAGTLLGTSMALTGFSALLGAGAITAYAWWGIGDPTTQRLVLILAWGALPQIFSPAACWFQSVGHPRPTVIVRTGVAVACAVARGLACWRGAEVGVFAWITLAEWTFAAYGIHAWMRRTPEAPRQLAVSGAQVGAWLKEGWPTFLMVFLTSSFERLDLLLLERLSPPAELGYLSAAQRFSELWWSMSSLAAVGFLPWLAEAKKRDPALYQLRLQRYADVSLLLTLIVAVGATAVGPWVLPWIFGPSYGPVTWILIALCWTALPVFAETMRSQYLLIERKQHVDVMFNLVNMLLLTGLALVWVPTYGALGMVWARLVAFALIIWFLPLLFPSSRSITVVQWKAFGFFARLEGLAQVLKLFLMPKREAETSPSDRS